MNTSLSALLPLLDATYGENCFAIDVGAYQGQFSDYLIKENLFHRVIAFEPNKKECCAYLDRFSKAGCNFNVVYAALSSKSGVKEIYNNGDLATASLLKYLRNCDDADCMTKKEVAVLTLDDYFESSRITGRLKLLKIDTQGHDLSVIMGGKRIISNHRPVIQTEFIYVPLYENQCTPMDLSIELSRLDYTLYSLNNIHVNLEGRLCFCDAVFIPNEINVSRTDSYRCIDDEISFRTQLKILEDVCKERLSTINILDAEVNRLRNMHSKDRCVMRVFQKFKSWVR